MQIWKGHPVRAVSDLCPLLVSHDSLTDFSTILLILTFLFEKSTQNFICTLTNNTYNDKGKMFTQS